MDPQTKKNQTKANVNDALIEQLRDVGRGVAKTVKTDLVTGMANDALSSLFSTPTATSRNMHPGEEVSLNQPQAPPQERYPFRPPMRRSEFRSDYSQEVINRLRSQEAEVMKKIEEIRIELKALVATLSVVDSEIEQAVSENVVDPGVYHLNFLERIKNILKLIRKNLHESRSWMEVMHSRKKQRSYWAMYKKKGTEWGLNNERTVATQVG